MWEYLVKKNRALQKKDSPNAKPLRKTSQVKSTRAIEQSPIEQSKTHDSASRRLKRTLKCPACQHDMNREFISHIEIDRCGSCGGIFLDKGELEMIHPEGYSSYAPDAGKPISKSNTGHRYLVYTPHGLSEKVRE